MTTIPDWQTGPVAVLASGGLDSAVLIGELSQTSPCVWPIYVRAGLHWEDMEQQALESYLERLAAPAVQPLKVFHQPLGDVYGRHWSTSGEDVPDAQSEDAAVFLPGRNLVLLSSPAVWCCLQQVPTIALGVLGGNPFPDATDEYFRSFEQTVGIALQTSLRVVRPYGNLKKAEVVRRGKDFPLGESLSCIQPVQGAHCGACNKCEERRRAFLEAGVPDPTRYVRA